MTADSARAIRSASVEGARDERDPFRAAMPEARQRVVIARARPRAAARTRSTLRVRARGSRATALGSAASYAGPTKTRRIRRAAAVDPRALTRRWLVRRRAPRAAPAARSTSSGSERLDLVLAGVGQVDVPIAELEVHLLQADRPVRAQMRDDHRRRFVEAGCPGRDEPEWHIRSTSRSSPSAAIRLRGGVVVEIVEPRETLAAGTELSVTRSSSSALRERIRDAPLKRVRSCRANTPSIRRPITWSRKIGRADSRCAGSASSGSRAAARDRRRPRALVLAQPVA